jgi:hypothetical protein
MTTRADELPDYKALLEREIIGPDTTLKEVQKFCEDRVPAMPKVETLGGWQETADRLRRETLERVVFRGEAAKWRDAQTKVEWLDTIDDCPGYRIKRLRYEALPGLWIPALLYEPEKLDGKVPVSLHVNGHDRNGKAAPYKQIRSINLAKRGMIVLNPEWLGMGQLSGDGFRHGRMNQLDLCGTSGLAPFYLAMSRGLDVLLAHPHADPSRVAVSGLSGGGWQTIIISSLDTRVKLCNAVAGYSSFLTRIHHFKDLGDSEQTPCDLATVVDYKHLTAMLAPRPTLLTYNAKDECCFESGYALAPLVDAAQPIFEKFAKPAFLRTHVNHDPGTHNFERENREAFYRLIGDHFYAGDGAFDAGEVECDGEVKSREVLDVELPADNANFNTLALALANEPRSEIPFGGPIDPASARQFQRRFRQQLARVVASNPNTLVAGGQLKASDKKGDVEVNFWEFRVNDAWTVPAVELVRGEPKAATIVIADAGRKSIASEVESLVAAGQRVIAVDPFYFGESKLKQKDYLFALLVAAVGQRPLGIQADQLNAVARAIRSRHNADSVHVVAVGPRSSLIALVAAALEGDAATTSTRPSPIASVELRGSWGSLKEVVEQNVSVEQMPEVFCFGLLKQADLPQLITAVAPRRVVVKEPSDRAKQEFAVLKSWYANFGEAFDLK